MPKKTKPPTIHPDDLIDAVHDSIADALEATNTLLGALVAMMSCSDCQGSGTRPTRDPKIQERCDCRRDAADTLEAMTLLDDEDDGDDEDDDADGADEGE